MKNLSIISKQVTGTVDTSLGRWKLTAGKLVDGDGVVHAVCTVENFAGGFDMGQQTRLCTDAAKLAAGWPDRRTWTGQRHEMRPVTCRRGDYLPAIMASMEAVAA